MFSKKGKRKIIVEGTTYYWCVTEESDARLDLWIQVFSENQHLFSHYVERKETAREPVSDDVWSVLLEETPQITPSVIERLILERKESLQ